LSYNKRESVLAGIKASLLDAVQSDLIYRWIPSGGSILATTGDPIASHIPTATGNRSAVCKADIRLLRTQFDKWDAPQDGRCLLLDAEMYGQLLSSLTETEAAAFLSTVSANTGIIGRLYGFDIYLRSKVAKSTAAGAVKLWTAAASATDSAAGIAWSASMVSRSNGDMTIYDNEGSAILFGDVLSGEVRAGGSYMRNDKNGVVLLYQGTPA
jgi:hypothetical protein